MRKVLIAIMIVSLSLPSISFGATKFLEPGGDADFLVGTTNGFWSTTNGSPQVVTDFVHGSHIKSIRLLDSSNQTIRPPVGVISDTGSRISYYTNIITLPQINEKLFDIRSAALVSASLYITPAGVLQLHSVLGTSTQIGTNGATMATGTWNRISLAYTITSTSTNRFELFVNGTSSISITNATLVNAGADRVVFGGTANDGHLSVRVGDFYIDDSNSLTDTGNIWVTAKRPNANGTLNQFLTQIGTASSSYGTGHTPQINQRPLSTLAGWATSSAVSATEEYSIESKSVGDMDISGNTINDYLGWVSATSSITETGSIIVSGVNSAISLGTSAKLFTQIASSTSYPTGNTDIGIISSSTSSGVSLAEAGIVVAFIGPPVSAPSNIVVPQPQVIWWGD